jgi:hypothetical protein
MDQIDLTPKDAADAARLRAAYRAGVVDAETYFARLDTDAEPQILGERIAELFPDPLEAVARYVSDIQQVVEAPGWWDRPDDRHYVARRFARAVQAAMRVEGL